MPEAALCCRAVADAVASSAVSGIPRVSDGFCFPEVSGVCGGATPLEMPGLPVSGKRPQRLLERRRLSLLMCNFLLSRRTVMTADGRLRG